MVNKCQVHLCLSRINLHKKLAIFIAIQQRIFLTITIDYRILMKSGNVSTVRLDIPVIDHKINNMSVLLCSRLDWKFAIGQLFR